MSRRFSRNIQEHVKIPTRQFELKAYSTCLELNLNAQADYINNGKFAKETTDDLHAQISQHQIQVNMVLSNLSASTRSRPLFPGSDPFSGNVNTYTQRQ